MSANGSTIVSSGRATPYLITAQEYKNLIAFTRGEGFKATRDRVTEFFQADKTQELLLNSSKLCGVLVITSAGTGALVGFFCGGPPGAAMGAGIGAGAGLFITLVITGVKLHDNYIGWKASIEHKFIIDRFKEMHNEHPILQKYLDPVTMEVMADPVITRCGHTFERKTIESWIDLKISNDEIPACPNCRGTVFKEELFVDMSLLARVKKVYASFAALERDNPGCPEFLKQGFRALHKDLEIQVKEVLKQVSTELTNLLNSNKITPKAYALKMREITEMFIEDDE